MKDIEIDKNFIKEKIDVCNLHILPFDKRTNDY